MYLALDLPTGHATLPPFTFILATIHCKVSFFSLYTLFLFPVPFSQKTPLPVAHFRHLQFCSIPP
jgi:hypothetical protein